MAESGSEHPEHLREAGETIHELREERHQQLPRRERIVQALMSRAGKPRFVVFVMAFMLIWVALNLILRPYHLAFDTNTFAILNTISQLMSLVIVLTILSAQNSLRTLEEERDRLTLQMSLVIDKKITEALRQAGDGVKAPELQKPTDLHQAAEALRKAEEQQGKDAEERIAGRGE
jgi:uncharacterized membrane protein